MREQIYANAVFPAQGTRTLFSSLHGILGTGLAKDTAPPSITIVNAQPLIANANVTVRARIHDRKSPLLAGELRQVYVEGQWDGRARRVNMRWYGEYLWRADMPASFKTGMEYRVCAADASGNSGCVPGK